MKDAGTFSWGYFIYAPFVTISLYNSYPSIRFADGNIISTHSISSMSIVRLRWNANSGWVSVNNAEEETMSGRTPVGRTIWESLDFDMQALCYVPEIVAFPRFLDGDEHAYMNDYLSSRYDITLS